MGTPSGEGLARFRKGKGSMETFFGMDETEFLNSRWILGVAIADLFSSIHFRRKWKRLE
jgi:hypothetical protein